MNPTNIFNFTLLFLILTVGPLSAQTGIHIQSRGLSNPILIGKDSVLVQASDHTKIGNRVALIDLKSRAWKFVNDTDYVEYLNGTWAMKSRTEGILSQPSPPKLFRTVDGWKSMTAVPDSLAPGALGRIEVTSAGYVAQDANGSIVVSPDGTKWEKTLTLSRGTYPWGVKGDVVYIWPSSSDYLSKDGGKTFVEGAFKGDYKTKLGQVMSGDTILFYNDTALIWTTDRLKTQVKKKAPILISKIWVRGDREIWIADALSKIHKTLDGGDTWNPVPAIPPEFNNTSGSPLPTFASGDNIFTWPYGMSKDGGATWEYYMPDWGIASGVYALDFRGPMGMMGKTKGEILFTTDKGMTFTRRDTAGNQDIMAVKILKNGLLLAGDRNGQVFTSPDTGKTWVQKLTNAIPYNAIKFQASEDEKVIVMSRAGQPAVSIDGGAKFEFVQVAGGSAAWTVKPNGTLIQAAGTILGGIEISTFTTTTPRVPMDTIIGDDAAFDMAMADANIGFLLAYSAKSKEARMYVTSNGWASTSLAGVVGDANFSAGARLQVIDKDTLFVYAENKAPYYRSADGGKTWAKILLPGFAKYPTAFTALRRAWFHNGKESIVATTSQDFLWIDIGSAAGALGVRPQAKTIQSIRGPVAWYDAGAKAIRLGIIGDTYGEVGIFNLLGTQVAVAVRHELRKPVDVGALPNGLYFISVKGVSGKTSVARILKR